MLIESKEVIETLQSIIAKLEKDSSCDIVDYNRGSLKAYQIILEYINDLEKETEKRNGKQG